MTIYTDDNGKEYDIFAYTYGRNAKKSDDPITDCPYHINVDEWKYKSWKAGWADDGTKEVPD